MKRLNINWITSFVLGFITNMKLEMNHKTSVRNRYYNAYHLRNKKGRR